MIITPISSALYPNITGSRQIIVGTGNGPSSYNQTTGDILSVALTGFQIDAVLGPVISASGNYIVIPKPISIGKGGGWSLYWYNFAVGSGTPAWTPISSGLTAAVAADQVQLTVIGLG